MPLFQADHSSAAVAMPEKSLTRFSVVKKILPCWSLLLLLMMLICRYKERRGKKFNFYISFQRLVFLPMYPMIGFVLLPSFLTSSIIRGQAKLLWSGWKNLKVAAPQDFPISWYDPCVCVMDMNHMIISCGSRRLIQRSHQTAKNSKLSGSAGCCMADCLST